MQTPLRLVIIGHVDHGKSTLIGRLAHALNALPEGKEEAIRQACDKRGVPFEWAFLMDALKVERDQGITLDTTQFYLRTPERNILIIDAPGHHEFVRNMVTGAAQADAALLIVDAAEGIQAQTRAHAALLPLLSVKQVVVALNKMDKIEYAQEKYAALEKALYEMLSSLGIEAIVVPISARAGENLISSSAQMPWYKGASLLETLAGFSVKTVSEKTPLRIPVQDIYREADKRIIVGHVESGVVKVGDTLLFSPGNAQGVVTSIECWNVSNISAAVGEVVGFTLDKPLFIERGMVASHVQDAPLLLSQFCATLFWLADTPLAPESRIKIRINTAEYPAEIRELKTPLARGEIGVALIRIRGLAVADDFEALPHTGRFVMMQQGRIAGGGVIDTKGFTDQRVTLSQAKATYISPYALPVTQSARSAINGHTGGILWFTGLSGSGKSTLAQALEQLLFAKGYQVYVLDGDNMRKGLNRDLGFSAEDRRENIRRAAEVAALFADAGFIVITAFITPTAEDRKIARAAAPGYYHSVFIEADLETCEKRDTKGLYAMARAGKIKDFTGISAPYELPEHADLVIDTARVSVHACVETLMRYIDKEFVIRESNDD